GQLFSLGGFGGSGSIAVEHLPAGRYFLQLSTSFAFPPDTNMNSSYLLALSQEPLALNYPEPGSTVGTARNLGTISSPVDVSSLIWGSELTHYYRFQLSGPTNITLTGYELNELIGVNVYRDSNGNGVPESSESVYSFFNRPTFYPGTVNTSTFAASAGTYFIEMTTSSNAFYRLNLAQTTASTIPLLSDSLFSDEESFDLV
ncbi:MAG: hypothetical protein CMJ46_05400, partial [Planctomyces sp.]|nr:hypothetical protein [Planctomyces sp.]